MCLYLLLDLEDVPSVIAPHNFHCHRRKAMGQQLLLEVIRVIFYSSRIMTRQGKGDGLFCEMNLVSAHYLRDMIFLTSIMCNHPPKQLQISDNFPFIFNQDQIRLAEHLITSYPFFENSEPS